MNDYKELEALIDNIDNLDTELNNKSIESGVDLYKQLLWSKEETIDQLKRENDFLQESLLSVQNIYNEDRETIETLIKQIKLLQDELEFTKRKYKLMWNKAVENYQK